MVWNNGSFPLLYVNPFDNITNKNKYSIILTLILFFDKEELLLLKNQLKLNNINKEVNKEKTEINENDKRQKDSPVGETEDHRKKWREVQE